MKFISLFLALCFLFIFSFSFVCEKKIKQVKVNNFNKQLNNINHQNNIYRSFVNNPKEEVELPIFTSAKEAIITATQNLKTRENFYVYSPGTITTDAGLKVVVQSQSQIWKWNNTEAFEELITFQTKGIDMGQTAASQTYTINGETFKRNTNKIQKSTHGLTSDFGTNKFTKTSYQDSQILHYTFNKNTILNESELIIYKSAGGKISRYSADFNLSTTIGIESYAKVIKDNSKGMAQSLPQFNTIKMRIEIDSNGEILSLYVYEECEMDVGITATLTNEFNYIFKQMENAPIIEKPIINQQIT